MFPVSSIDVFSNGTLRVKRDAPPWHSEDDIGIIPGKRGKVANLSSKSLARLAFVSRETTTDFEHFATLTYPDAYPRDGRECKKHLNRHLGWLRRRNMSYLWFLEFQVRGAPHYHVFIAGFDGDRIGHAKSWARASTPDRKSYRNSLSVHTRKRFLEPIRSKNGAGRYATKYALKTNQKAVPSQYVNCGRFWGCSTDVVNNLPTPGNIEITEHELRELLRRRGHPAWSWEILPTFLFLND